MLFSRPHSLTGDCADRRECHIDGDFLLVYKLVCRGSNEDVIFVRASAKGEGKKAPKTGRQAHP
jgi:mRNA-degrading endonuclease YafQ of YafQ-DinJ toxin-antitoxin module